LSARERIAVALDGRDAAGAIRLVDALGDLALTFKVGPSLLLDGGPDVIRALRERGRRVFLDVKLHDIPRSVAAAVAEAGRLGASLLTLHAAGGRAMLRAARRAAPPGSGVRLLAVTVLTSLNTAALRETLADAGATPEALALRLARLARDEGIDGVVASGLEARGLRAALGPDLLIVTPGIRGPADAAGDQRRTLTAREAIAAGADLLVIGRPVIEAPSPRDALAALLAEVDEALR
jgi:orotidine-5'-phosphate decarboxylase